MRKISILLLSLIFFWGCSDVHFIQDNAVRAKVSKRFEKRKEFASNRFNELFSVFQENITTEEKEALQFLYAYMPLCDLADYNGDFFLKQVRSSFEARESFEWGMKVPDELFRHFVLPYRVNNENLDSARMVFLKELKPRLQGMSMKEAVLEVNHWCHEKVNYAPTDIRTSGPLSIVRTSWGRCGEESTFTVTALRSVGIPARQVYTPRWAHSDDNHAWVEVWTDGKWSYLSPI
jgi:transglutaminase-like putative cysteine protease